jgi:FMN phosphatase YigB (HAD superfamily)
MKNIQLVLFDLGNVLVRFTPESFWQVLGLDDAERARYSAGVRRATTSFETGRQNTTGFFDDLVQVFGGRFKREHLRKAVASVLTEPICDMESIVSRVTQRVTTALVSNTNEFHYNYCMKAIPAMKMLPKHYLSYKLGIMKPHPDFYRHVLRDANVEGAAVIFIDDMQENVDGAVAAGMNGILFKGSKVLSDYLKTQGILET